MQVAWKCECCKRTGVVDANPYASLALWFVLIEEQHTVVEPDKPECKWVLIEFSLRAVR